MPLDAIADVQARIAAIQNRFAETSRTSAAATGSAAPAWATGGASPQSFADVLASLQGGTGIGTADATGALGNIGQLGEFGMGSAGTTTAPGAGRATNFVTTALGQTGKRYVFGATASANDPNPAAFDCSELVQWAAERNGVALPRTAGQQYATLAAHGDAISVDQALRTPGALLFSFSSPPTVGGAEPAHAHVAISLGDGRTIEARGRAYGVGVFDAGNRFTYAAVVPGLS